MDDNAIKQNVLKLQNAKATPQDIENYVKSAVSERGKQQAPAPTQAPKWGDPGQVWQGFKSVAIDPILHPIDNFIKPAAKFIGSGLAAPVDIVRGAMGQNPMDFNIPGVGRTIQSEFAQETVPKVESGEVSPLEATTGAVGQTVGGAGAVLGGAELAGFAKKGITGLLERKAESTAANAVAPRLSSSVAEQSTTKTSKIRGLISRVPTSTENEAAQAVKGIVKGKSFAADKELVKKALGTEADSLESKIAGVNQPVSSKGASTWLDNVEKPIEMKADPVQGRRFDIVRNAFKKIIDKNVGENPQVSSLLKSRKEFDALVDREFPTLYDRENAPFRSSVKAMRDGMNNAIEANLPEGFGYKESLRKQKLFYDAIDNLGDKAARGAPSIQGEIGTTRWGRFKGKHPTTVGLIKKGAGIGATALGVEGLHELTKN